MDSAATTFLTASSTKDFLETQTLFLEYEQSLGFKLDFQDFHKELQTLQNQYIAPKGGG